ncbi:MAG TPA: hypothetical protein VE136_04020 [Anaerolineales bacterium]|jgi:uncharacterized membrane protein|nr:hypothetical protein [Anaerolineales bacterium]
MNYLMIAMRLIHIFSGVFWVGASFTMLSFVTPSVAATGAEGQKFMQHLGLRTRYANTMLAVGVLTFLSGLIMYWQLSGFRASFLSSGYGLFLTIGGTAGFLALLAGYTLQYRSIQGMKALSAAIGAAGGPPSADQRARMGVLSQTLMRGGQITTAIMVVALIGMAVAQYAAF